MAGVPRPSELDTDEGWAKSSFSSGAGECIEVKQARTVVAVRDSKDREAGLLTFPPTSWHAFVLKG